MKLCAPLTPNMDFDVDKLDELNIRYTDRHSLEDLMKIVSKYKNKRLNIRADKALSIDDINLILSINENIYIRLTEDNVFLYKELDENNVKYFFNMPVYSYTLLEWVAKNTNSTDIYIYDDLCYNLSEVKSYCEKNNINIRMVLNKLPVTFWPIGEMKTAPIFRPEYSDILNMYIDTAEFNCYEGEKYLWNKFKVYYKRWFVDKKWADNLVVLNEDIMYDLANGSLIPGFEEYRFNCRHRCSMSAKNNCNRCERYIEIANIMEKEGYAVNG